MLNEGLNVNEFYNLLTKVSISILCGLVIGINRERKQKAAGIKTNVLICLGSTVYTYISHLSITPDFPADPNRAMAQIISGIGFLGAGAILRSGGGVIGLTTAASIWVVAAIGASIGIGAYYVALVTLIGVMIVLVIVSPVYGFFSFVREYEFTIISTSSVKKIFYGIVLNSGADLITQKEKIFDDSGIYKTKVRVTGGMKVIKQISSLTEEIDQVEKIKFELKDT
jgi:putative Mg2+ transporter-C (MgtC) family protein